MSFLTHLECALCGGVVEPDRVWNLCPKCDRPLLARYDLEAVKRAVSRKAVGSRPPNLWRYRELLPVANARYALTLGEGFTPLTRAERLGSALEFPNLWIKDESLNPTGSFKARGLSVAVSRAFELGVESFSIPSAGNAGCALSAYAALAGLPAYVYMPRDVPDPFVSECRALGAEVTLVDGLITDCARAAGDVAGTHGRFDVSTMKEPYRVEGKKTMAYELAEQMHWRVPGVIIYPTGGGTGLVGMWKAFDELEKLGWIGSDRPRLAAVQSKGCAPIVKAFDAGSEYAEPWPDAKTVADGLRVPSAVGDFLMLRALRESGGTAVSVFDVEMIEAARLLGKTQGIFSCPEGGATLAAFIQLRNSGWIGDDEQVVLMITGSGHKYAHLWNAHNEQVRDS